MVSVLCSCSYIHLSIFFLNSVFGCLLVFELISIMPCSFAEEEAKTGAEMQKGVIYIRKGYSFTFFYRPWVQFGPSTSLYKSHLEVDCPGRQLCLDHVRCTCDMAHDFWYVWEDFCQRSWLPEGINSALCHHGPACIVVWLPEIMGQKAGNQQLWTQRLETEQVPGGAIKKYKSGRKVVSTWRPPVHFLKMFSDCNGSYLISLSTSPFLQFSMVNPNQRYRGAAV